MALAKQYEPKEAEKRWQQRWEQDGIYHFVDDKPRAETFVIDTPPPTVSGLLHMGHIFSYTQADFIARYQRMSGRDVCYPMGFDDNGLPTERLVEKVTEKKASQYESREAFIAACKEVVFNAEEEFRALFKSVALSVDWRREYQTISEDVRKLSQSSFLDLLQKGEAYRDFRPTYWDWVDQTAIAQAEIENKEMPGVMNEIIFTLDSDESAGARTSLEQRPMGAPGGATGDNQIVIMTTRPELLGACVAVMYHPEDPNAAKYKDKHAITPLFGVKVPMIADEAVEREKGTGLVMCCTFGDDTDKEWWRTYKLPTVHLLQKDGRLNIDAAPAQNETVKQLHGLKPKQANTKIIELLQAAGKLLKQTPMTHTVKCAERSGTPIEIIPTHQWFVRITDKKEALIAKARECNWCPEFMRIRIEQWTEGLKEDWCISRQRFFGVPFPVWYSKRAGEEGKIITPALDELPVDPLKYTPKGYNADELTPDKDVMDTWATSSISPQINAKSLVPNKLYPADIRPQAHEIIRTWAFYTIVKSALHANTIPWKNLMISGWCLAADKTKMSKSKGNVVTPVALIEDKGADAVRYWASTSRLGMDTAFSEDLLKIGKKLVGKIWNASNFVALQLAHIKGTPSTAAADVKNGIITEALDKWILTRLARTVEKATKEFEQFEYCDARVAIEDFFWNDFCDNYLELVKARAYGTSSCGPQSGSTGSQPVGQDPAQSLRASQDSALYTLHHCLNTLLRLFAPFVPHVTDEVYTSLFSQTSVHARGSWPKAADFIVDEAAERTGIAAVEVLNLIRKTKSEANVSIKFPVNEVHVAAVNADAPFSILQPALEDLKAAGTVSILKEMPLSTLDNAELTQSGTYRVGVSLATAPDKQDEKKTMSVPSHGDDREIRAHMEKIGNQLDANQMVYGEGKVNAQEVDANKIAKAAMDKAQQGRSK